MKLLVGLGNPGEKYASTRHNLGFMVVDRFLKDYASNASWSTNTKLRSEIALFDTPEGEPRLDRGLTGKIRGERVILAKPQTYMNNSGMGVKLIADYYNVPAEDIWIVHDELDLPVGALRIRFGGAAAGHHGVESVIEHVGTDKFWRFRLGVGVSHASRTEDGKATTLSKLRMRNAEEYVLGNFASAEQGKIRDMIKHGSQALTYALEKGLEAAMNRFNTR